MNKRPLRHADPAKLQLKRSHSLPTARYRGCARRAKLPSLEGTHMTIGQSGSLCILFATSCADHAAALLSAVQHAHTLHTRPKLKALQASWNPRLQPILLPHALHPTLKEHNSQTHRHTRSHSLNARKRTQEL